MCNSLEAKDDQIDKDDIFLRAKSYLRDDNYDNAISCYHKVISCHESLFGTIKDTSKQNHLDLVAEAYHGIGLAYYCKAHKADKPEQKYVKASISQLEKAKKYNQYMSKAYYNLGLIQILDTQGAASVGINTGQITDAVKYIERSIELFGKQNQDDLKFKAESLQRGLSILKVNNDLDGFVKILREIAGHNEIEKKGFGELRIPYEAMKNLIIF